MDKETILRELEIVESNGDNLNELAWTNLEDVIDQIKNSDPLEDLDREDVKTQLDPVEQDGENHDKALNELAWTNLENVMERLG